MIFSESKTESESDDAKVSEHTPELIASLFASQYEDEIEFDSDSGLHEPTDIAWCTGSSVIFEMATDRSRYRWSELCDESTFSASGNARARQAEFGAQGLPIGLHDPFGNRKGRPLVLRCMVRLLVGAGHEFRES